MVNVNYLANIYLSLKNIQYLNIKLNWEELIKFDLSILFTEIKIILLDSKII